MQEDKGLRDKAVFVCGKITVLVFVIGKYHVPGRPCKFLIYRGEAEALNFPDR
jgi:hypothetical protein